MLHLLHTFLSVSLFPHIVFSESYENKIFLQLEESCANKPAEEKEPPLKLKQIVYQTVKAPQIEPVEVQDKDDRVFNRYDLLKDKPAGLILEIKKRLWAKRLTKLDKNEQKALENFYFSLSLKVNGELYDDILCSDYLERKDVKYQVNPSQWGEELEIEAKAEHCRFYWRDLTDESIYKFIPLPTYSEELLGQYQGFVDIQVLAQLKYKEKVVESCSAFEDFTVNMLSPKPFKILFTGMNGNIINKRGRKLCDYGITDTRQLEKIVNSKEVRKHFLDMFPVSNRGDKAPLFDILKNNNKYFYQKATCHKEAKQNLGTDVINLNKLREIYGGQRIIAVVPEGYILRYGAVDTAGFIIYTKPIRKSSFSGFFLFSRPNYQVIFIKEDEINTGTLLHELAHTLGQNKEFYESKELIKETPYSTPHYHCDQFTYLREKSGEKDEFGRFIGIPCSEYRITGGLLKIEDVQSDSLPPKQIWKLLNNQHSIMANLNSVKSAYNYEQWIDRDTYQKILKTMVSYLQVPEIDFKGREKEVLIDGIKRKQKELEVCDVEKRTVINVSGIYQNEESDKKKHLTDFSIGAYRKNNANSLFLNEVFSKEKKEAEENHLKLQLERGGQVIEEIILPKTSYIEFFYRNGQTERREEKQFPFFVSFSPLCVSSDILDYRVSMLEVSTEKGLKKEEILIDSSPVQWKADVKE